MKKIFRLLALSVVIATLIPGCKKESGNTPATTTIAANAVEQGTWKVILFTDHGNDETNHFSGYAFKFSGDGVLVATNNNRPINGTWSQRQDDNQVKLIINFTASPLNDLSEDWHIVKQNATDIELEDISGGNGGTKYLNFRKI